MVLVIICFRAFFFSMERIAKSQEKGLSVPAYNFTENRKRNLLAQVLLFMFVKIYNDLYTQFGFKNN
jgi:hypothetical protein